MPREVNPSHVEAARLRKNGVEWIAALKKAKVPDTDLARMSVRRILRELGSKVGAERDAAAADLRAKRKDMKAHETALELAADLRVKRKDLKARETALERARRALKSPLLKQGFAVPTTPGGAHALDLTAESPEIAVAAKAKLAVARQKLRELNTN